MSDDGAVDIEALKARLDPRLNEPYFTKAAESYSCLHWTHGVKLDTTKQRAYCRKCGEEIALFDALLNYHNAEERLVAHVMELRRRETAEAERKQREKERRPFARSVVDRTPRKDMTLKAEPLIGYVMTLECGHKQETNVTERKINNVTCHQCKHDAAAKARAAKL